MVKNRVVMLMFIISKLYIYQSECAACIRSDNRSYQKSALCWVLVVYLICVLTFEKKRQESKSVFNYTVML